MKTLWILVALVFGPLWARGEAIRPLERLRPDGTLELDLRIDLGELPNGRALQIGVKHQIERASNGREQSAWRFSGLSGYLIEEDDYWSVEIPGPQFLRLAKMKESSGNGVIAYCGPILLKSNERGMALVNGSKGAFYFSEGLLMGWRDSAGFFRTKTQGGRITSIVKEGSKNPPLLETSYLPTGQPKLVKFGAYTVNFEYPQPSRGPLARITVLKANEQVKFYDLQYEHGLLVSVSSEREKLGPFKWRAPSRFEPIQMRRITLESDGQHHYIYSAKSGMVVMGATDLTTKQTKVVSYNAFNPRKVAKKNEPVLEEIEAN